MRVGHDIAGVSIWVEVVARGENFMCKYYRGPSNGRLTPSTIDSVYKWTYAFDPARFPGDKNQKAHRQAMKAAFVQRSEEIVKIPSSYRAGVQDKIPDSTWIQWFDDPAVYMDDERLKAVHAAMESSWGKGNAPSATELREMKDASIRSLRFGKTRAMETGKWLVWLMRKDEGYPKRWRRDGSEGMGADASLGSSFLGVHHFEALKSIGDGELAVCLDWASL